MKLAFNLKFLGGVLLLIAGFIRFVQKKTEPSYAIALAGGILLSLPEMGVSI